MMFNLLFLYSLFVQDVKAAYCSGSPAPGERESAFPIYDQPAETLTFVKAVPNAILYEAGPPNATFPVVHLYGSPYEVGFAQGTLMKETVREFVLKTWAYLDSELVDEMGDKLSPFVKELIVSKGMATALDWAAEVTAPFTPAAYYEEVQGLADSTGLDYNLLYRINMFPELTKAQCSFFGAWGSAVA